MDVLARSKFEAATKRFVSMNGKIKQLNYKPSKMADWDASLLEVPDM